MESSTNKPARGLNWLLQNPISDTISTSLELVADVLVGKPNKLSRSRAHDSLRLPEDLFAQTDAQTEWWYYTGHCETAAGRRFAFEFVFFQRRTDNDLAWVIPIRLLANPMYAAHFAIADIDRKSFRYLDKRSHTPPFFQESGAALDKFELQLGDWRISGDAEIHSLEAGLDRELEFSAELRPIKPYVKNGHQYPDSESSTHFSCTRMEINGEIRDGGLRESFTGTGWMDREFGTWFQRKWDWFSIQLDNDCELMIYRIWDESGTSDRSHGTFVDAAGKPRFFTFEDFEVTATGKWKSPRTGTVYPSGWKVYLNDPEIEIEVTPLLKDQELNTEDTTMVIYWEGVSEVTGTFENKDVKGNAFVELVGYTEGYQQPSLFRMLVGTIKG